MNILGDREFIQAYVELLSNNNNSGETISFLDHFYFHHHAARISQAFVETAQGCFELIESLYGMPRLSAKISMQMLRQQQARQGETRQNVPSIKRR